MDRSEFISVTNRIEQYFDKSYTTEQLRIMYEELQNMPVDRYREIIAKLVRTSKFLPKIADVLTLDDELPKEIKEIDKKDCKKCGGTGYLIYKKVIEGSTYDYACLCNCGNGTPYHGKDNYIPYAAEIGL